MTRPEENLPSFLQQLHSDEFGPQPRTTATGRACEEVIGQVEEMADDLRLPLPVVATTKTATAAGLLALNRQWGSTFYELPDAAALSVDVAGEAFAPRCPVVDVQTHFLAPHSAAVLGRDGLLGLYKSVMPDWWTEMRDIDAWSFAEWVHNVFVESETAVAILTSGPGVLEGRNLFNDEIAAARLLVDAAGERGRILNHAVVHADIPSEVEMMTEWRDRFSPVGWKVYTPGRLGSKGWVKGWMLDDEQHGLPFLERVRDLGTRLVCAHKGISQLVDNGSPRDIGPAAKAFPEIDFVVYHSGYEMPLDGAAPEGPYSDETRNIGVNRLLASLEESGIAAGKNVYAELGSTWFCLVSRPLEAAHLLGKLFKYLGPDNVIWGTDSIWFGSPQPLIDAFRVFQIPEWMCEQFGYQPITDEVRRKVLCDNAVRVYGLSIDSVVNLKVDHDRQWAFELADRYREGRINEFR